LGAEYPTKVTTQLKTAVNNLSLTLTDDVGENADEIFVGSTEGVPDPSGSFHIENEIIFYPAKTSIKFGPGLTRGADGTTKAVHLKTLAGGEVKFGPEAHNINNLNDEVIATQTALGITGAFNFANYGKNLIPNHAFADCNGDNLPDFWALLNSPTLLIAADTLFPARGGNQITITATGTNTEGIATLTGAANLLKVLPSTIYTFSIDYKVTAGDFLTVYIRSYNGAVTGTIHIEDATLASTTATRVAYTFTTDADADNLRIALYTKTDGDIVIVSHPKLEQGAIATPYIENQFLTNKRITKRVVSIASSAAPTPNGDITDIYTITALAEAATFGAPTGTPQNGQTLLIRIKDNGTARALSWNAIYRTGTDVALPTTTVISKTMYVGFIYNFTDTKWDLMMVIEGF